MTNNTNETGARIKNLLGTYAVHGGRTSKLEIIALSVVYYRQTKHAAYRIATLADGSEWLAVKYRATNEHPVREWQPVFAAA